MLGKKAENLRILREHGFPVPEFITVSKNMDSRKLIIPWETCAVRSCAAVEDGADKSFAGQFDTYLNVKRADAHAMIDKCFASMEKDNVKEYARAKGISFSDSDFAVIVQEMIPSEYSGVCFTANPTGLLNEMVIVVGKGTGDNVVEDKVETTSYYYNVTDKNYYYEGKEDNLPARTVEALIKLAAYL